MNVILIPAYEPDRQLVKLVGELAENDFKIVVVDDGSGERYAEIFNSIRDRADIVTLDKTQFVKGGRSIKINSDGKKIYWVTHYMPSLKPNRNYEVTWFVRTENLKPTGKGYQGRGGASFVYGTGGKQFFFPHNHYQNSMPWTPQRLTFRSEPNTGKKPSFLRLGVLHATGAVWFDDIRVRELPEKK